MYKNNISTGNKYSIPYTAGIHEYLYVPKISDNLLVVFFFLKKLPYVVTRDVCPSVRRL